MASAPFYTFSRNQHNYQRAPNNNQVSNNFQNLTAGQNVQMPYTRAEYCRIQPLRTPPHVPARFHFEPNPSMYVINSREHSKQPQFYPEAFQNNNRVKVTSNYNINTPPNNKINHQQGKFGAIQKNKNLQSTKLDGTSHTNNFQDSRNEAESSHIPLVYRSTKDIRTAQSTVPTFQNKSNSVVSSTSKTEINKPIFGSHPGDKLFMLTGTAERVIHWNKLLSDHFCYFEVIATVVSLQEGTVRTQTIMLLRDRTGPILQVVYYLLTYIAIEDFHLGKMVRCVGKMIGPNIMNAISIRGASKEEIESLQRLTLISEQAIGSYLRN